MGWSKSELTIQRARDITAIYGVVHCNQDMFFVQKVLFVRIGTD
ncbi:hypothetical protein [Citrobacter pasteurii]|nr:hypothetical protein [Citrobacter pasteurii]